jgi:predicted nucleic acid-binding protein
MRATNIRLVTTQAILIEIGNALSKRTQRQAAVRLLRSFESDANIEIVPLSAELYEQAFRLYSQRGDKEWGLTDCISFVVMSERGITSALTGDRDFQQAGFRALLLENAPKL